MRTASRSLRPWARLSREPFVPAWIGHRDEAVHGKMVRGVRPLRVTNLGSTGTRELSVTRSHQGAHGDPQREQPAAARVHDPDAAPARCAQYRLHPAVGDETLKLDDSSNRPRTDPSHQRPGAVDPDPVEVDRELGTEPPEFGRIWLAADDDYRARCEPSPATRSVPRAMHGQEVATSRIGRNRWIQHPGR